MVQRWFKYVHDLEHASRRPLTFVLLGNRWINAETGTRSDVPHNMIYPLKETRPNLHFLTGVQVMHVTFDECVSL